MKYGFSTKILNNGKVIIGGIISVPDDAVCMSKSTNFVDVYFDVFETLSEAKQVRKEMVEENKAWPF